MKTPSHNKILPSIIPLLTLFAALSAAQAQAAKPAASAPAAHAGSAALLPPDVEKALAMPEGPDQIKALVAAAREWAKTDPAAAIAWAAQLKRTLLPKVVFPVLAVNPQVSAEWAAQKPHRGYFHPVMYAWGIADPRAAAAWCATAPPDVRYLAFFSVGDGWLRKNRADDIAWAAKLETEADQMAAVQGIAIRFGRTDVNAAADWIKTLKPAEMKLAATVIAADWHLTKLNTKGSQKADVVKPWLDQFPFSAAEKEEILTAPAPDASGPHSAK